jgi:hypothetical protein
MEDFTIVVQGPLTKASTCACVHFLDHYNEDYPVVISTWSSDNNETVEVPEGVTVVYDDLPDREQGKLYDPQSTFYWAVKSQYNAVANVKTKYVVKTRTDEGFYPIKNIIDSYREGDAEVLFGNVFFKPFKEYAYHIGDHLYVCETEVAVKALKTLLDIYEEKQKPQDWAVQNVNRSDENSYCAEQILAFAFLEALGYDFYTNIRPTQASTSMSGKTVSIRNWEKKPLLENFDIYDIDDFEDYVCRWAHENIIFSKNPELRKSLSVKGGKLAEESYFIDFKYGAISRKEDI